MRIVSWKYKGFFKDENAVDLGVMALKGTMESAKISADQIQAVFMGNVVAAGLGAAAAAGAAAAEDK